LFRVARCIWQGGFASRELLERLRQAEIACVLNVSDVESQLRRDEGPFESMAHVPIADLTIVPVDQALECLATLHRFVCRGNVYVHCMAGWNRSAVIVWLYLVACGVDRNVARRQIEVASYDAVPTHQRLVNEALIEAVREYGRRHLLPHARADAIEPHLDG
jgi:protein-tyrosine phosphatase